MKEYRFRNYLITLQLQWTFFGFSVLRFDDINKPKAVDLIFNIYIGYTKFANKFAEGFMCGISGPVKDICELKKYGWSFEYVTKHHNMHKFKTPIQKRWAKTWDKLFQVKTS